MFRINVKNQDASLCEWETLTSGSVGVKLHISFGPEWDGLIKTACFENGLEELPSVTIRDGIAEIPRQALARSGCALRVGVYGETVDGTLVIPTVYTTLGKVLQGAEKTGRPHQPPTPDWTTGIEMDVNRAVQIAQEVQCRANAGEFNGKDGAAGPKGDPGPAGPAGKDGDITRANLESYVGNTSANAIRETLSGAVIATDMVSPEEHQVECRISSSTVTDLSAVTVSRQGQNLLPLSLPLFPVGSVETDKGLTFTALKNGGVLLDGTLTASNAFVAIAKIDFGNKNIATTRGQFEATNGEYAISKYLFYQANIKTLFVDIVYSGEAPTLHEVIYPLVNKGSHLRFDSYTPTAEGTVEGMTSLSPNMTIYTDTEGVNIEATYNCDTKKYIDRKLADIQSAMVTNV